MSIDAWDGYQHAAFSGYGVEIEHMIVDSGSLSVMPVADRLLDAVGGAADMDVDRGAAAWSNELALHVIETKTAGPAPDLAQAVGVFRAQVDEMTTLLSEFGARLMPTGMHPWMDPLRETRLWPHQNDVIYQTFDRIFDCSGHGWSNLQSTHVNFPFSSQDELRAVHTACRFVLPLVPALAASSPFRDGRRAPAFDARLLAYRGNCARVPSVTGDVVPPVIRTREDYDRLLAGIYADLSPFDPEGILANEWVNARGCIARFDRGAVEIRLLDAQECPEQDLALVALVVNLVHALAAGEYGNLDQLEAWTERDLLDVLERCIVHGAGADLGEYGRPFGQPRCTAEDLRRVLAKRHRPESSVLATGLDVLVEHGTLAERLVARLPEVDPGRDALEALYAELCDCLQNGQPFVP